MVALEVQKYESMRRKKSTKNWRIREMKKVGRSVRMQGVYQRDERAEEKVYNELYQNQKDFFLSPRGN